MGKRDTWALGPFTLRRHALDFWAGGRMSGHGPDVRDGVVGIGALWIGGAGCPARCGAPDVQGSAGCPAAVESPSVYLSPVFFWLVAPDVRALAGCPAAVALRRLHLRHFSISFRVNLSYASSISMVISSVPGHK